MSLPPVPSVTLSEVLQLALPPGSGLLAGEAELSRRVHWARLLRARAGGALEPGELLILPPTLFETMGEPRLMARQIGELVEAGAAAFVVSGEPPEALIAACKAQQTPLLQVPAGTALPEVERSIVGLILDREGQLRRRAEEVYGTLLSTMLSDAGLAGLVSTLAEATGLRASIFDDYLELEASAPEDELFDRSLAEAAAALRTRDEAASWRPGRPLSIRVAHQDTRWSGQLYPLQIGDACAGFLALLGRPGQGAELERLLIERASALVTLELAKQRAVADAAQRSRGELLDDLLEGNFPTEEAVLARGRQLGYELLRPTVTVAIGLDPAGADGSVAGDHLTANRQRRRFIEVAKSTLLRMEPRALTVEREGVLVALIPAGQSETDPAQAEIVEGARASVATALPDIGVSAGVSGPLARPGGIGRGYQEATQALTIGQKLLGGQRTVDFAELGIERLLYHLLGHPDLEQFVVDTLGDLLNYDAARRGELAHTLEVFLACNGNHVRAAKELHLHRNTLLYRLDRIREILGRDLEDPDVRLGLQVALRIRESLPRDRGGSRAEARSR